MGHIRQFIDGIVIPWATDNKDNQKFPFEANFIDALEKSMGTGVSFEKLSTEHDNNMVILETDVVGIISPEDEAIINHAKLRLRFRLVTTVSDKTSVALMEASVREDDNYTAIVTSKLAGIDNTEDPRGLCHRTVSEYIIQSLRDRLDRIKFLSATHEGELHKLFM